MSESLGRGEYEIVVNSDKAVANVEKTKLSFTRLAGATIGLTASVTGAVFALDSLNKTQTRINALNLKVEKAQERVNKMYKEGKASSEDFRLAVESLKIAEERAENAANDLTQSQVAFALNIATIASVTLPNFIKVIGLATAGHGAATAAVGTHTTATIANTVAIKASTLAMLFNPLTAAAVGIAAAAAVALLATNTFGLRDAVFGVTEATEANTAATNVNKKSHDELIDTYVQTSKSTEGATRALEGFKTGLFEAGDAVVEFYDRLRGEGLKEQEQTFKFMISSMKEAQNQLEAGETSAGALNDALASMRPTLEGLRDSFDEAWGEGAFRKRLLEMRKFGELTREEFNHISRTIDLTNSRLDALVEKKKNLETPFKSETREDIFKRLNKAIGDAIIEGNKQGEVTARRNLQEFQNTFGGRNIAGSNPLLASFASGSLRGFPINEATSPGNFLSNLALAGGVNKGFTSNLGGFANAFVSLHKSGLLHNADGTFSKHAIAQFQAISITGPGGRVGAGSSGPSTFAGRSLTRASTRRGSGSPDWGRIMQAKMNEEASRNSEADILAKILGVSAFQRPLHFGSRFGKPRPGTFWDRVNFELNAIKEARGSFLSQVEDAKIKRTAEASQIGLTFNEFLVMQSTHSGALDFEGMLDYNNRRLMVSSGVN